MSKTLMLAAALPAICCLPIMAGPGPALQPGRGIAPPAGDGRNVLVQAVVAPGQQDESTKPAPPPLPVIRAADWIAAWQSAKDACPDASVIKIHYTNRSGPSLDSLQVFECIDMQARGELLIITIRPPLQDEKSVTIVRAGDVLRIEISKPNAFAP